MPVQQAAVVERETGRRTQPAREQRHAADVAERETRRGVRQEHGAAHEAEPRFEDLRVAGTLRRVVVKQHDSFRDGHRACRPRDDRASAQQPLQAEQAQPIQQYRDVPAGEADDAGAFDEVLQFRQLAREHGPRPDAEPCVPACVDPADGLQVLGVEAPDRGQRGAPGIAHQLRVVAGRKELARCGLRVRQTDAVELLQSAQVGLPAPVGLVQLGVLVEHGLGALVETQVAHRVAQVRLQGSEFAFALLPAGGNGHDRAGQARPRERIANIRGAELRAKYNDVAHGHLAWEARVTVSIRMSAVGFARACQRLARDSAAAQAHGIDRPH